MFWHTNHYRGRLIVLPDPRMLKEKELVEAATDNNSMMAIKASVQDLLFSNAIFCQHHKQVEFHTAYTTDSTDLYYHSIKYISHRWFSSKLVLP